MELQTYLQIRQPRATNDWALKIAHYLVGTLPEANLLDDAQDPNPKRNNEQFTEAWFFVASKHLVEGDPATAKDDFEKCLATNAKTTEDYKTAEAELKYLAPTKVTVELH